MKFIAFIFTIIVLLSYSCASLNITEIKNLEKVEFDSLKLFPARETNYLRIDIIRQTYEENINDSAKETKNTPYHPIGFSIGNGLFYDLNKNLCMRIDYLAGFSPDNNFEIQKINRPEKQKEITVYRFYNDTLTTTYLPRKKVHYNYHQKKHSDSTSYMYKNRLRYAIIKTDTSLTYSVKRRKWNVIHKPDENIYYVKKRRRKENYQLAGNTVFLEKDYIVNLSNNNLTLEIKRYGKRHNSVLYTIEKSRNEIFIYNKKYFGKKIIQDQNTLLIYRNKTLLAKYELKL